MIFRLDLSAKLAVKPFVLLVDLAADDDLVRADLVPIFTDRIVFVRILNAN